MLGVAVAWLHVTIVQEGKKNPGASLRILMYAL